MNQGGGGGGNDPPPSDGGEFLLSLLQKPNHHPSQQQFTAGAPLFPSPQPQRQQPPLAVDPAVAAVGPTLPLPHHLYHPQLWQSNGPDHLSPLQPWPHLSFPSTPPTPNLLPPGFPQSPLPQFQGDQQRLSSEDAFRLGFPSVHASQNQQESGGLQKLQFGSIPESLELLVNANLKVNTLQERRVDSSSRAFFDSSASESDRRKHQQSLRPPPGFSDKPRGGGGGRGGKWDYASPRGKELDLNVVSKDKRRLSGDSSSGNAPRRSNLGLTEQFERPGPPAGSKLHSVLASDVEESLSKLDLGGVVDEDGKEDDGGGELDDVGEELVDSLLVERESEDKQDKKQKRNFRDKESRSDSRGQRILSQRMRMFKSQMRCRGDIERFSAPFLAIFESLIPPEEEKVKQKQLLASLEKLVNKEWPKARLYLYGSCANSFGVLKSDIDVCLTIEDTNINKSEVLLKLADLLQSGNLQNVQALTRARVPIVKLMDPVTGISCDICINNVLAVVNTKLLQDYAKIDARLRQLAFIVKYWAKSRGVNETYQGTLSSYAYVLMCIHFLQQRRPAILPCLQGMDTTYSVTVDNVQCSFFDQVEKIQGFGSRNRETIAQLVWAFFNYWAYCHDYANDVISVRMGSIISKWEKDWTRRVGNDRHLICIEDPFETSHDLGRVVDKYSIRVLREEFERAAEIMQFNANPCVTLFEPYVPS